MRVACCRVPNLPLAAALRDRLEIAELLGLIERHEWFKRAPIGSGEPESLNYRVVLNGPAGRKRFRVTGVDESVQAVEALLDRAARRRLEPILDRLPPQHPDP